MSKPVFHMPVRIQMSRRYPWRAQHPDAVICARPHRFANPYKVAPVPVGFMEMPAGCWGVWKDYTLMTDSQTELGTRGNMTRPGCPVSAGDMARWIACETAVVLFNQDLYAGRLDFTVNDLRAELAGRDLGCWCKVWDETTPCPACHGQMVVCPVCDGSGFARWPCHCDVEMIAANPAIPFGWAKMPCLQPGAGSILGRNEGVGRNV